MLLTLIMLMSTSAFLLSSFFVPKKSKSSKLLGGLSFLQGLLLMKYFLGGEPTLVLNFNWMNKSLQTLKFSFLLDGPFIMFASVALFVSWSILSFSTYYMASDPNSKSFQNILMLFLFFMLLLTSANNLFLLFVGWEGVGILSFILMGWWHSRSKAKSSALQAMIYNRIGDMGMLLFLALSIINSKSWKLSELMLMTSSKPLGIWALLGMVLGASGKSAQFCLHPWLPAAMEGPTPVSALLHSSTMVVAGVFLLIRCFPLFSKNLIILNLLMILGSMTSLFAGSAAAFQFDMKKIIAYSTTSQLGLMMIAMGLGLPTLALFHICTHAFFKALLFLCSGSLIHKLNNEQDIRRMGKMLYSLPLTSNCLMVGTLALCGFPFLAGFYSKDLMIEASHKMIKSMGAFSGLMITMLTLIYSLRLIFFLTFSPSIPLSPQKEEHNKLIFSLLRLTMGALIAGWFLSLFFFNYSTNILPYLLKLIPLVLFLFLFYLIFNSFYPFIIYSYINPRTSFFYSSSWFYSTIIHSPLWYTTHNLSLSGVLRTLDQGWFNQLGPGGITNSLKTLTITLQNMHLSSIINYFWFSSLLILFLLLSVSFL